MGYKENAEARWTARRQPPPASPSVGELEYVSRSAQITINVAADRVWEELQDPMIAKITSSDIVATFHIPDTPPKGVGRRIVSVQRLPDGRQLGNVQELVEFEDGRREVWISLTIPNGYESSTEVLPASDTVSVVRVTSVFKSTPAARERAVAESDEVLSLTLERLRDFIEARYRD